MGNSANVSSASSVTIAPETSGGLIYVGTTPPAPPQGGRSAQPDARRTHEQDPAGTLIIGNASSGNVTIGGNLTFTSATDVELDSGGNDVIGGGELNTDGGTLTVDGDGDFQPTESGTDVAASTVMLNNPLGVNITGTTVDTGFTQLNVSGTVDLNGQNLDLSGSYTPADGDTFTIVSATSVSGTFNNLAEGDTVNLNGEPLKIHYTSNSVTLSLIIPPTATVSTAPPEFINETSAGAKTTTISITYASSVSTINASTFGVGNISVSNNATVTRFKAVGDVVTYTITAPEATWGAGFQGTYTISLNASVMDEKGVPVAANSDLASFVVDTTPLAVTIGEPSLPATHSGPVTYSISYSDADFNSSSLTAANVILHRTGTANGTVGVDSGTGDHADGDHQQYHGAGHAQHFPGSGDGLGHGRQHGPGRRPQRLLPGHGRPQSLQRHQHQ